MKNLTQTLFILISFFLISTTTFATGKEIIDTTSWVEVDGKVLLTMSDDTKLYNVVLICQDVVVGSVDVKDDESFLLKVKKNSCYTIRISKEGYHSTDVMVNTSTEQSNMDDQDIHINAELISNCVNTANKNMVDLSADQPTPKKRSFVPAIDYHVNISSSFFNVSEVNPGYSNVIVLENAVTLAD